MIWESLMSHSFGPLVLSGRAFRTFVDGRAGLAGVSVWRAPERRSRAAAARLLAALNSGPYSAPNMNSTGLRCRPSGVGKS